MKVVGARRGVLRVVTDDVEFGEGKPQGPAEPHRDGYFWPMGGSGFGGRQTVTLEWRVWPEL